MKPIKLKIKGLNSFIDEQIIDFERLTDKGLFGIFGPTGSGKSTVLDGITLALYGDVARKSSNYINTNCDRLNVSFEFQISGVDVRRYIVDREFRRKKDSGNPISGKCKIVDITDNEDEVLADKVGTVTKKVEEIIGLNLEDFTRTVVLPQGKFSEFLKLEGKERREMLERLFNLQKYGDNLSRKLSFQINKEKTENHVLIGQLTGYDDINEELFKEKEEELKLLNKNLKEIKDELEKIEENYKDSEELWNIQLELIEYKNKESKFKEKEEEIKRDIDKIRLGEAGSKVVPYIKSYENTIKELKDYKEELDNVKKSLSEIAIKKDKIQNVWNIAKDNKDNRLPDLILNEQKVLNSIEEKKLVLDIQKQINYLKLEIEKYNARNEEIQIKLKQLEEEKILKTNNIKNFEKNYDELRIDEMLKEKVQQGMLEEERYSNINSIVIKNKEKKALVEKENLETIENGKELRIKIDKKKDELKVKQGLLEELIKNCPGEQKDLLKLQELLVGNKEKWNRYNYLKKEIKIAKDEINDLKTQILKKKKDGLNLEKSLEKLKIKFNEATREHLAHKLREELKDGEICPVCGSTHHIKENINSIKLIDLKIIEDEIKNNESLIKVISEEITINETKVINFNEKILSSEEEIKKLGEEFKSNSPEELEENFAKLKESLENYTKEKEQLEKSINELKNEISIEDGKINELRAVVRTNNKQQEELEKEIKVNLDQLLKIENNLNILRQETLENNFKKKNDEIKEIEKQREKLAKVIKSNREELEKLSSGIEELNKESAFIKEKITKDSEELRGCEKNKEEKLYAIRNNVGNENDLDLLLNNIQNNIRLIKENFESADSNKNKIEKDFTDNNERLISISSKYEELNKRKQEDEVKLELAIENEGFNTLEDVKKNIIEHSELKKCKENVEIYKENVSKINGAIESLLRKINGRELTKEQWDEIRNLKEIKENKFKEVSEEKIKIEEELKNIGIKLDELKGLLDQKKKLDHKLALLGDLEKLFKGKRFVEFVAANQLKYVSIEASKRLKEITHGNYGLEVDEDGKFIIRDYKNGGAEREASTLSGGETFLASLALALALSAQIQLKGTAPLELFFLDEGFGTLDEDLLEVVMSSLERIHNEKLKVGIISHVESIKNRVPVKLIITPAESGIGGSKVKIERS